MNPKFGKSNSSAKGINKSSTSHSQKIWQVYWPLAMSWFFMAWEGQLTMWLIGLMPNNKVYQAGFLVVMGLAIFIESPVIDLLSTGTTLGTNKARFAKITQFTQILMAWVTLAHCAVVFSPLYNIIAINILETPPNVAQAAWYGLAWMPIWSACVGWRRYRQGIMIRSGRTKPISWGTLIRVITMVISGIALYYSKLMVGLGIIGISFTFAVLAEAIYIHIVSKPVISQLPTEANDQTYSENNSSETLSLTQLFRFHLPLTASTMLMLTAPVLMTKALNQSHNPVIAMAAWQTAGTVTWLFRTFTFALPEAVISVYEWGKEKLLASFCAQVGGALSFLMVVAHITGIDYLIFLNFFKAEPEVARYAAITFLWCSLLPVLNALMSYYRGILTSHHITGARMVAIILALVVLAVSLTIGKNLSILSVISASVALTIAHIVELVTLAIAWIRSSHNPPHKPTASDNAAV